MRITIRKWLYRNLWSELTIEHVKAFIKIVL